MRDTRGSRFLRMAGSDQFFSDLNKGLQKPPSRKIDVGDYGNFDSGQNENSPTPGSGPGSFGKQVEREVTLRNSGFTNDSQGSYKRALDMKRNSDIFRNEPGGNDASGIVGKYINSAKQNNPINVEALDRNLRRGPLYHEAKAELEELKLYGDRYRFAREESPDFQRPDPMEEVEKPDFDEIGNNYIGKIEDLKIKG